jgi:hypothetical protein
LFSLSNFSHKKTIRQTGRDAGVNARRAELGKQHSVRYKFLFLQELQWRAVRLYIDEGALAPSSTSRLDFLSKPPFTSWPPPSSCVVVLGQPKANGKSNKNLLDFIAD